MHVEMGGDRLLQIILKDEIESAHLSKSKEMMG
jgi:hypothetical protein